MNYTHYYSMGLVGIEVRCVDGETMLWRWNTGTEKDKKEHKSKIRYTSKGRAYAVCQGYRVYLDECLRKDM